MWNWADDYGVGEWTPRELLGFAFPNDDHITGAEFQSLCTEVAGCFGTQFYVVRGRRYYAIPSWDDHQKNERRARGKYPTPDDAEPAPAVLDRLFDDAWSHWPKKVERKAARERFGAAAKKLDVEVLVGKVNEFGDAYARTTEKQFVPALGVWLGHERWTDELPQGSGVKPGLPQPPRDLKPAEHSHRWMRDGSCLLCTARMDRPDTW
jgi:hypothetical protein